MTKRGLGRGLDALIPPAGGGEEEAPLNIAVDAIVPNPFQPRKTFAPDALAELADSIRQYGVLQPVIVRQADRFYELVAGERRWRAAKMAGLSAVPAVVKKYTDLEMTQIALIENLQRQDLDPVEEARAYAKLIKEFGFTQEEVAARIGKSRAVVANAVRLLNLPEEVLDNVSRGTLTVGQVRPLLAVADKKEIISLAERIVSEGLSARDAEELVRRKEQKLGPAKVKRLNPARKSEIDLQLGEMAERLRNALGTQVRIVPGKIKGRIEIEYYSADDLERIINAIAGEREDRPLRRYSFPV